MAFLNDTLTLDKSHFYELATAILAVRGHGLRGLGVYEYADGPLTPIDKHGLRDVGLVNVLRDEANGFRSQSAMAYFHGQARHR